MSFSILVLAVLGFAASVWMHYEGLRLNRTVISLFNLDNENNLPTWYSSLSLVFCAALLFVISAAKRIERDFLTNHWLGLACIFVALSLDEMASIHERAGQALAKLGQPGAVPDYSWVFLAAPLLVAFGGAYIKFLRRIPRLVAQRFIVAGSVYISGAVITEVLGVSYAHENGYNLIYYCIANLEELLEMVGVLLFVRALLYYMADNGIRASVALHRNPTTTESA